MTQDGLERWLKAMAESAADLGSSFLGLDGGCELERPLDGPPSGQVGAYVPLVGVERLTHIGLSCTAESAAALARTFMGMEPEDDLEEGDLTDALGEIANILAGGVKGRLEPEEGALSIGLPLVVRGEIEAPRRASRAAASARLGSFGACFQVLQGPREGANTGAE